MANLSVQATKPTALRQVRADAASWIPREPGKLDAVRRGVDEILAELDAAHDALVSDRGDALDVGAQKLARIAPQGFWDLAEETRQRVQGAIASDLALLRQHLAARLAVRPPAITRIAERSAEVRFLANPTHALSCSVCDRPAMVFDVRDEEVDFRVWDAPPRGRNPHQHGSWAGAWARTPRELLLRADGQGLLDFLGALSYPPGCDAYCPECKRVYCRDHVTAWAIRWGEYEAMCPFGHTRELH